jgi:hypothetical protein
VEYLAELFPDMESDRHNALFPTEAAVELSVEPPYVREQSNTRLLQFGDMHVCMFPRQRGRGGLPGVVTPDGRTRDANETRA